MTKSIFWTGYSNQNRLIALHKIEEIISLFGYITDSTQFSDISIMLKIELPENKIQNLQIALEKELQLSIPQLEIGHTDEECIVYLNITFTNATGNLSIEIPAVPG